MTVASMSGASGLAIRTEDLRKTYKSSRGDVPAVRGIDLNVSSGQFFGLLGPNGAGKSTTIGMLTTLILPTGGQAWVAGMDVVADPVGVKRRIGVVTQNNTLDMQLTVAENLEFRSRFFGLSLREASRRADQLLEVFGLADRRKAMSTDLSGGQAKRLLIARALVHRPDVLFLDEPTAGLDPQTRANLRDILRVLHGEGQTILLTTHYMEEAEALCERVAVIDLELESLPLIIHQPKQTSLLFRREGLAEAGQLLLELFQAGALFLGLLLPVKGLIGLFAQVGLDFSVRLRHLLLEVLSHLRHLIVAQFPGH